MRAQKGQAMGTGSRKLKRCIVGSGAAMVVALSLAMDAVDAALAGDVLGSALRGLLAVGNAVVAGHLYAAYRRHADEAVQRKGALGERDEAEGLGEAGGHGRKGRR